VRLFEIVYAWTVGKPRTTHAVVAFDQLIVVEVRSVSYYGCSEMSTVVITVSDWLLRTVSVKPANIAGMIENRLTVV
jgi:hypothetical protein